jgi:hypothetical protein
MTLSPALPEFLLQTILAHLTMLFLAGTQGNRAAARQAAIAALADHQPRTAAELRLAAKAIAFNLQVLEALGQAASLDVPMTQILRLRSGAVSLNREAEKAETRLHDLQQSESPSVEAVRQQPHPATSWSKPSQPKAEAQSAAATAFQPPPKLATGSAFHIA